MSINQVTPAHFYNNYITILIGVNIFTFFVYELYVYLPTNKLFWF